MECDYEANNQRQKLPQRPCMSVEHVLSPVVVNLIFLTNLRTGLQALQIKQPATTCFWQPPTAQQPTVPTTASAAAGLLLTLLMLPSE